MLGACLWLDEEILDAGVFILDDVWSLDAEVIDDDEDTDEFADELPESLDTTTDDV